jgi:hypothetical protein
MNRLIIGSGDKSPLLLQMMLEDFATGFTLVDPTGELAEAIADRVPVVRDPLQVLQAAENGVSNVVSFVTPITAQSLEMLASLMDERKVEAVDLF